MCAFLVRCLPVCNLSVAIETGIYRQPGLGEELWYWGLDPVSISSSLTRVVYVYHFGAIYLAAKTFPADTMSTAAVKCLLRAAAKVEHESSSRDARIPFIGETQ